MSRNQICERVERLGLLPVVRAPSAEGAIALGKALFEGGIHCLEITLTVPGGADVIRRLREELGEAALVGAGTVTNEDEAKQCLAAGAQFIVSPATVPALVPLAHAANVPVMLGALTPTEVLVASRAGADFVKVFPCSALGGAEYLKALKGPFPNIKLLPTGGVTLETMASYLAAGAAALGVGTALADYKLLQTKGHAALVELAQRYSTAFRDIKKPA
jgi:2-dehydro-3-deoxyphosphogluconate aldolase / (4S)-4-hydroxy-2-oxoglutarate aldolase